MANQVQPTNQFQYLSPYSGRLFDFDTTDSRVYLSSAINTLFSAVGGDCILGGLNITSVDYNGTNDIITVGINRGKAIIDSTLIDFKDPTTLDLDVTSFDDQAGKLVVSMGFSYVPTIYANKSTLKLRYITNDGSSVLPDSWYLKYDRVVVAVIAFNKVAKTATLEEYDVMTERRAMTIQGQEYEINPLDNISTRVRNLLAP
jgi:hypothetical protein